MKHSTLALTVMCGLSFSGKSTLARRLARDLPADLISLDLINAERGLDGGQGIPVEEWVRTNRISHERAEELLREGSHVVVDDTGSPRFIRDGWREAAVRSGAAFALVWIQIDPELQRERLLSNRESGRRPDVTDAVLAEHVASFEPPVGEGALTLDAHDASDPDRIAEIVRAILARVPERDGHGDCASPED